MGYQNNKKEIKIVGAGLSGLTAAINLAKAGYKVKIFEKNDIVGKRFHSDYQGIENWVYNQDTIEHLKNLNIELNFPQTDGFKRITKNNRKIQLKIKVMAVQIDQDNNKAFYENLH